MAVSDIQGRLVSTFGVGIDVDIDIGNQPNPVNEFKFNF